jgi:hypothetical protein
LFGFLTVWGLYASQALAGFDRVIVSEVTAGQGTSSETTVVPSGTLLILKPNGDAQVVFARDVENSSGDIISRLFALPISSDNVLGSAQLLVETSLGPKRIRPMQVKSSKNGNAVVYYQTYEGPFTNIENWAVSYIAQDIQPWKAPVPLTLPLNDIELFMNDIGQAFYFSGSTVEKNLYQYMQLTNTWDLVSENVPYEPPINMGDDNSLFYTYKDQLSGEQRLVSFDTTLKTWSDPLVLNMDGNGNTYPDAVGVLVSPDGNDVYAVSFENDYFASPQVTRFSVRKYQKTTGELSATPQSLEIPLDTNVVPITQEIHYIDKTKDNISFIVLLQSVAGGTGERTWKTQQYNEITGWFNQTPTVLESSVSPIGTLLNTAGRNISTGSAGHAVILYCKNACQDIYARIFDSNGWSEELYLPEFGNDYGLGCGIAPFSVSILSDTPQYAVNSNDQFMAMRAVKSKPTGDSAYTKYQIASMPGDILTASSYTDCLTTGGNTGGSGNDNGGGSGTDTGNKTSDTGTGGGGGSVSFWLLALLYLFGRMNRKIFSVNPS